MGPECFLVPPHSGTPTCPLDGIRRHDLLAWSSQEWEPWEVATGIPSPPKSRAK